MLSQVPFFPILSMDVMDVTVHHSYVSLLEDILMSSEPQIWADDGKGYPYENETARYSPLFYVLHLVCFAILVTW